MGNMQGSEHQRSKERAGSAAGGRKKPQKKSLATQATGEVQTVTEPTFLQTSELEIVKEDWKKHQVWINKDCFFKCWDKIWQWIDVGALTGQLMKHGLINGPQDFFLIDAAKGPRDRADNLQKLTGRAGEYGYHRLYMCIRDCEENRNGHSNVVRELNAYAEINHIQPPPELTDDDRRPPDGHGEAGSGQPSTPIQPLPHPSSQSSSPSAQLRQQSGGASGQPIQPQDIIQGQAWFIVGQNGAGPQTRQYSFQCTQTPPPLGPQYTSESVHYSSSLPAQLSLLPSEPIEEKLVSKELERMFLPSLNKLREKMEMEEKIATHKRHCKAMKRIRHLLHSNSREQTSEDTQAIEEILREKEATISRLQFELELAKLEYSQADKEMSKARNKLDAMWKNRDPVDKIELKGSWRIASTEDGKLLATIIDSKGRVAQLERKGDKLRELKVQMIHRNDEQTCEWTPAGIAVDEDDIYVGDAAGAVPPGRTREQHINATTDISNQGKSKLLRFKLLQGKQVPEEQPLQVDDPSGMAFRGKSLYVCDRSKHQVTMLDCTNECTTLSHYGKKGTGDGEFRKPTAIAFDDNGNIYVLDQGNCRVQVFSPEFRFLRTFGGDELRYPAFDIHVSKEFVYVTQTELNCVSVFDKQYGIFVVSFSNEKLKHPVGIVADREGYIYVCGASNVWLF